MPFCGYTDLQRYAYTYERQTLPWKGNEEPVDLLKGLHAARAAGDPALRAFLGERFDVDMVLRYLAIMNWAGSWGAHPGTTCWGASPRPTTPSERPRD